MSFKQYRSIDLVAFVLMYCLCEYLVVKAATVWFDEPYSISIMLPLLCIVMMRWDKFAIVHAVAYALWFVYLQKGNASQYLIYLIGNLGFMLNYFLLMKLGKENVRQSFFLSMAYLLTGFLLMEVFRGIASMVILGSNIKILIQFILTDMLSLVFSVLVIIIVRRIEGLYEDQKHYLIQLNSQKESIDGGWQDE